MKKILLIIIFLFLFSLGAGAVGAGPRLYLDPASGTFNNGSEFNVAVKVDPSSREIMAVDALLSFDSTKLEAKEVIDGKYFSGFDYNIENGNGRLTIYSFSTQTLQTKSQAGTVATVTFKTKAEGSASVSFLCQAGNDSDSAIWDSEANDLIDCASNGSGNYTIGAGSSGETPTTAPTSGPTTAPEAPTSTPSTLPETGIETPLLISLLGGGIMVLLGVLIAL